ncbi:Protein of unknown function [Bradyrhizobium brasilense]|uniref:DUF2971 domain-containing protein n=1 Tax=Bradyrhizobium brasilense TaxID=1419277 RepID=A0A1G7ABG9_9BRAD|nr:DUF2971 domain-containing protein [Bradyrhizobium brasilense]SDE12100.1 Protein of unknown function [Bradyrhizobium brasilense]
MALLSHYTSRVGLEGIAKSKTWWATSFLQLNDASEYFYAWEIVQRKALRLTIEKLPAGVLPASFDLQSHAANATAQFRQLVASSGDGGLMYVASFATASTEDHERRGILTLWDRYTQHKGYCLQFEENDIRRMLDLELQKGSYAALSLERVRYGVDENDREFKTLSDQLAQIYLLQAARARPDLQIEVDFERLPSEAYLLRRLMEFCARHKDPCFEDEREVRIFAFPADEASVRFLTGIAGVKKRRQTPAGKTYIALGEYWDFQLTPRRIIIGTRADPDIASIVGLYDPKPEVYHASLPIA